MNITASSNIEAPPDGFKARFFAPQEPAAPPATESPAPTEPAAEPVAPAETPAAPAAEIPEVKPPAEGKKGLDALADDDEEKPADAAEEPAAPDGAEEPPAGVRTKEAQEAWKRMRLAEKKLPTLEKELAELKTKLESSSKLADADPLKKEIETLRQRDEEREKEAAIWRVERTQAWKAEISEPLGKLEEGALAIAKEYEINPDNLLDALTIRDRKVRSAKLSELIEAIPQVEQHEVLTIASHVQSVLAKRDAMEANAHEAWKEAQAREKEIAEKTTNERRAAEMRAAEELRPKLADAAKLLAREGETHEAYAARIIDKVSAVPFDEHPAETKVYMAAAAGLLEDMAPALKAAKAEIAALKKQVSGMSAANPRTATGAPANSGAAAKPGGFYEGFSGTKPPWARE